MLDADCISYRVKVPRFLPKSFKKMLTFLSDSIGNLLGIPCSASDLEIHELIAHGFTPDTSCRSTHHFPLSSEYDQIVSNKALKLERHNTSVDVKKAIGSSGLCMSQPWRRQFSATHKAVRWLSKPKKRLLVGNLRDAFHYPSIGQVERLRSG